MNAQLRICQNFLFDWHGHFKCRLACFKANSTAEMRKKLPSTTRILNVIFVHSAQTDAQNSRNGGLTLNARHGWETIYKHTQQQNSINSLDNPRDNHSCILLLFFRIILNPYYHHPTGLLTRLPWL